MIGIAILIFAFVINIAVQITTNDNVFIITILPKLVFQRLFTEGNFEAHNMMFTIELLRQTFKKNQIEVGDFISLYNKLNSNTLEVATPDEISWPSDMKNYVWNPDSLKSIPSLSLHE